ALDRGVQAEADQRDRAGDDARGERDGALDGHPREREPGEELDAAGELLVALARDGGGGAGRLGGRDVENGQLDRRRHARTSWGATAASMVRPCSVSSYMTILPSRSERARPAAFSWRTWCETSFSSRPTIHARSHTQARS